MPTSSDRPFSESAPATISAAEAEASLASTTTATSSGTSVSAVLVKTFSRTARPFTDTIVSPAGRNMFAIASAASSRPPGLNRMSKTNPRTPASTSACSVSRTSPTEFSLNCVSRT